MASISDYFGQTGSATAPAPITTVKTARLVGETVLAYNSVPGFQENTPVFFVTYKKVTDPVTGEISAVNQTSGKALANTTSNTLTNIVIAPGYTDIGNAVGDFLEVIPTSYWADSLVTGLAVSLNADGTFKTGAVTSTALAANAVTTAAIADKAVTPTKIDMSSSSYVGSTITGYLTGPYASFQAVPSVSLTLNVINGFIDFRLWAYLPVNCSVTIGLSGANTLTPGTNQAYSGPPSGAGRGGISQILTGLNNGSTVIQVYAIVTSGNTVYPMLSARTT